MTPPPAPIATASEPTLPIVAKPSTGVPLWAIIAGAVVTGLLLFLVLDARRRAVMAPSVRARSVDAVAGSTAPPALYIPPEPAPSSATPFPPPSAASTALPQSPPPVRLEQGRPVPQIIPYPQQPSPMPVPQSPPARAVSGSALVIDSSGAQNGGGPASNAGPQVRGDEAGMGRIAGARVGAGVLANRALTVAQGTLIPAVLETALDSTLPGLARAIVSSDIRGFDGTRVLIPRGSRLIGEYAANSQGGQNRMLVNWLRLIRPDGATIAIGSPAADPVGRGGVRASVNSHFLERFSGAILQSALDIGVNLASRSADSPVIVALPGTAGSIRQTVTPAPIRPTLKVRQATSISVFVARDLDFKGVEER